MLTLDDLHDAILETVSIAIDAKTIALAFTPIAVDGAPARVTLIAHDWKSFSCPRQDPWGHALYWRVNVAQGPFEIDRGLIRLELEMQSGDLIEIHAVSLERIDTREAPAS